MTSVEASDKRKEFCARLKSERERRGRSLAEIATSTKIKASLLDALERGDLSRWPKGIYRRSFFRDYVVAIGLHPDPFVSEFLDVFAEAAPTSGQALSEPVSFRMMFAEGLRPASQASPTSHALPRETRLLAAAINVLAVVAVAAIIAAATPASFAATGVVLGTSWYFLSVWLDTAPVTRLLGRKPQATPATLVQSFEPGALPYNTYAPASSGSAVQTRVGFAFRVRTLLTESLERVLETPTAASSQRRHDLASVRRRRVKAANSATADEFSIT